MSKVVISTKLRRVRETLDKQGNVVKRTIEGKPDEVLPEEKE